MTHQLPATPVTGIAVTMWAGLAAIAALEVTFTRGPGPDLIQPQFTYGTDIFLGGGLPTMVAALVFLLDVHITTLRVKTAFVAVAMFLDLAALGAALAMLAGNVLFWQANYLAASGTNLQDAENYFNAYLNTMLDASLALLVAAGLGLLIKPMMFNRAFAYKQ